MALKALKPRLTILSGARLALPKKVVAPWYQTPEHKAWRETIITRAAGICEWAGCTRKESRMFADHIVEIRDGGSRTSLSNGQCLCGRHHTLKTSAERAKRLGLLMSSGGGG